MSEVNSSREIYYQVLAREAKRQGQILEDPSSFLEELKGYTTESDNTTLRNIFADEIHLKRIWGGILLVSQLRKENDPRWWWQCEPVIRNFWNRVTPLLFREGDSLSELLKKQLYASIFGEEDNLSLSF